MRCPVCGSVIPCYLGFDGSRVIAQCRKNPLHFFFPIELFLKEEFLPEIVVERVESIGKTILELAPALKREYSNARLSMVFINPKEARRITSMGSRVAFSVTGEITREEVIALNNKYAMTIRIILREIKHKEGKFKRRII